MGCRICYTGAEAFDGLWGEEMRRKRKRTRCDDAAAAVGPGGAGGYFPDEPGARLRAKFRQTRYPVTCAASASEVGHPAEPKNKTSGYAGGFV